MAYSNGRLPAAALSTIPGTNRQIRSDLVNAVAALRAAFQSHFGKALTVTDAYRPYEDQERIFRQRYTTSYAASAKIDPRSWNGQTWWRRAGVASASTPGKSNHGLGQAIDFGSGVNTSLSSAEHRWMRANAPRYGWTHPSWASTALYLEPWHWEGVPVAQFVNNPGGGGTATPVPTPTPTPTPEPLTPKDLDMSKDYLFQIDPAVDGRWVIANYGRGEYHPLANGLQLDLVKTDSTVQYLPGAQPQAFIAGLKVIPS